MNPETGRFESIPEGQAVTPGHVRFTVGEKFVLKGLAFNLDHVDGDRMVLRYDKLLSDQLIQKALTHQSEVKKHLATLTRQERRKLLRKRRKNQGKRK